MNRVDTSGAEEASPLASAEGGPNLSSATREAPANSPLAGRRDSRLRWLTYLLLMPLAAVATAAFASLAMIASVFDGAGRMQHSIAHVWGKVLLKIAISPVSLLGGEHIAKSPVAVYVVNHLSYMDTPVLFSELPFQFRILARHDLFKLPFIGWYLQRSGQVPVDSSSLRSSLASLNRGVRILQAGMPLVVFPEGGRSLDGKVQPFLSGPAFMAIRAGVPVVPMALIGTYEVMPMHTYHLHPRPVTLVVGEPIATEEYNIKMADVLSRRLQGAISDMYRQYSSTSE